MRRDHLWRKRGAGLAADARCRCGNPDDATTFVAAPRSSARDERGAANLQPGGKPDDQAGEPLCQLWGKVWARLPPPLGPSFLSQGLQGQIPCENGEGPCAGEKVVRLSGS